MVYENNCEEVAFEKIDSEITDQETESAAFKITTYGADLTLEVLFNKMKDSEIVVPPFQRKYVWQPPQASKLVESFLLGLPVPQIFLYKEEENQDLLVVDGQQRLKTIRYFFEEKFEDGSQFYLRTVKQNWEGKTYTALAEADRRRFKNSILRATIFQQTDPKDKASVFEIFSRLNTGGMPLNMQEIRNCVVRGKINSFLDKLNLQQSWRTLYGKASPDSRMRDVEMILRFLALHNDFENYSKPMKDWITGFMDDNKNLDEKKQREISELFEKVMMSILKQIGERAFKLKAGINIAIFDSITVALARIGADKVKDLYKKYGALIESPAYQDAISKSTTDKERVESRIKLAIQKFLE